MIEDVSAAQPTVGSSLPRWRIAVIAAVAVLAVAIGAVLGMALTRRGTAGLAASAGYVPADAVMYLEGTFDLNDAQRADLRALIERFPGADADKLLTDALAQTLDDALSGAPFDYSNDIAPWFDGHAAVAVLSLPMATTTDGAAMPSAVALFGVKDQAAANAFVDTLRNQPGATWSSTDVRGVTVWQVTGEASAMVPGSAAIAVTNDELLVGSDLNAVTSALDVHAGATDALADRSEVSDLTGHLPDGAVGVMTMDTGALLSEVSDALASQMPTTVGTFDQLLSGSASFVVAGVSFETDAVRLDSAAATGESAATNGARDLADQVPADAMLFADGHDLGAQLSATVANLQDALTASGMDPATLQQIESALGGSLGDWVSWIGDGAMVAGYDGEQPYLGFVLEAADATAAAQRMSQLEALVQLATLDPSSGVTVSTQTVAGVEVTTLRLASGGASDLGVTGSPADILGPANLVVQWAVDGDRVLLGLGDRFVPRVLQLDSADSLGATSRFVDATGRFPGDNSATLFVDVAAIRDAISTALPADAVSSFAQVDPYLAPFDYLVGDTRVDGGVTEEHLAVVMK